MTQSDLPDDAVRALAERDVLGEITEDEAALLLSDSVIERYYYALKELRLRYDGELASVRAQMKKRQQASLARGVGDPRAMSQWFRERVGFDERIARIGDLVRAAMQRQVALKPRLTALRNQQHDEIEEGKRFAALRMLTEGGVIIPQDEAALRRLVAQLTAAITPLASLDYLMPAQAPDNMHVNAYKAVRLKVSDIRAAREAWLAGQAYLGGEAASAAAVKTNAVASKGTSTKSA